ncbi:MAG: hypothetical protein RDV48_13900 [Candidatus Eremiobacteraeota bacterium]|nr:hypothetical protein [Candidatus Eremiobacteraeota bacterium]
MAYLFTGLAVVFFLVLLFWPHGMSRAPHGASRGSFSLVEVKAAESRAVPPVSAALTRDEARLRLEKLANSAPPSALKMGAECYKVAFPPERAEYLCPSCGMRTLYVSQSRNWKSPSGFINSGLAECRRLVKEMPGSFISIDESEFCRKCSPKVKEPELVLVVRYGGEKEPSRFRGITADDLKLVKEFLEGKDKHSGSYDEESPLKNHMARLKELLGIK